MPRSHTSFYMLFLAGIGIVELGSEEEAQRAVEGLNGKEILGRWVTVRGV